MNKLNSCTCGECPACLQRTVTGFPVHPGTWKPFVFEEPTFLPPAPGSGFHVDDYAAKPGASSATREYNCNCDASAGAPRHSPGCPENDLARPAAKICDGDQGLLPCICKIENPCTCEASAKQPGKAAYKTEPQKPVLIRHPLVSIAEWRKGCSCAPKEFPVQCEQCTEGLIRAIEGWFAQRRSAYPLHIAPLLAELSGETNNVGVWTLCREAARMIQALEAELYAAQDQVAGLQELMRTQRAPENLDVAVRHLVAAAEADDCHQGSPEHGHRLAGRWDGDNKHPKGSLCEECAAWDILRKYVATDVAAVEEVLEPKPGDVWALPVDLVLYPSLLPAGQFQSRAVEALGIKWEKVSEDQTTKTTRLLGCTNVPVNLPKWLEVAR